jgi:flagellin
MSRINTNVPSLLAQRVLGKNNEKLNTSLTRLSTGLKINSGADDPAGLIASENLRAEKTGISAAIDNAERAGNIIGTAEGGLSEISSLLNEVQTLVSQQANSGGLSQEEKEANQLQVDSILNTVNRLAGSTSFQGQKLLNGTYDYTTSGVDTSKVNDVTVNGARLPDGSKMTVNVEVVSAAEQAVINTTVSAALATAASIQITGNLGTEQISFTSGASIANMAEAINGVSEVTGIKATVSGTNLAIQSVEFGSDQEVKIKSLSGTAFANADDAGKDVVAKVNGAAATGDGQTVSYRNSAIDIEVDLSDTGNAAGTNSFAVTGGGANFSLGAKVNQNDRAGIGIKNVSTTNLGSNALGFLSSLSSGGENSLMGDNLVQAQRVLDESIKQVSSLRGRLGAFQKFTIGSTVNALGVAYENASAAESAIRDTDFAEETAALTRMQILTQSGTNVLSQANSSPQAALQLLG